MSNHTFHHSVAHIYVGLKTGLKLAKEIGTDEDVAKIEYAIRMLDRYEMPTGVTNNGVEVPVSAVYSQLDIEQMRFHGCD